MWRRENKSSTGCNFVSRRLSSLTCVERVTSRTTSFSSGRRWGKEQRVDSISDTEHISVSTGAQRQFCVAGTHTHFVGNNQVFPRSMYTSRRRDAPNRGGQLALRMVSSRVSLRGKSALSAVEPTSWKAIHCFDLASHLSPGFASRDFENRTSEHLRGTNAHHSRIGCFRPRLQPVSTILLPRGAAFGGCAARGMPPSR